MNDNTLSNVSGKGTLVKFLDDIVDDLCPRLLKAFAEVNGPDDPRRQEFFEAVDSLKVAAFWQARMVEDGGTVAKDIIDVVLLMTRLDAHVHMKDIQEGPFLRAEKQKRDGNLNPEARKGKLKADPKVVIPYYKARLKQHKGTKGADKLAIADTKAKFGVSRTWVYDHLLDD